MPPATVRQILAYLTVHGPATNAELSLSLGCTRANIYHHLKQLVNSGTIRILRRGETAKDRGRPSHTYVLTGQSYPENHANLVSALLTSLLNLQDKYRLKAVSDCLFPPSSDRHSNIQTLNIAILRLNEQHYSASWEARRNGPCIVFHNCPYLTLVDKHPQLCLLDQLILENLTGKPVHQSKKQDYPTHSQLTCEFEIFS